MMHGRNNAKKLMAVRIVKHAFEIIHLLTGEVCIHNFIILSVLRAYLWLCFTPALLKISNIQ